MVVPLKVSLPTTIVVGYITKTRPVRLLDRVNIYRSYIGSRRSRHSRLLFIILIAIAAIESISSIALLLLLLYV